MAEKWEEWPTFIEKGHLSGARVSSGCLASAYFSENPHASFLSPDDLEMCVVGPAGPDHDWKAPKHGTTHETTHGDAKRK